MELPRLTEQQFSKLTRDFVASIDNVRRINSPLADYQMMLLYKLEHAYKALDSEIGVIENLKEG